MPSKIFQKFNTFLFLFLVFSVFFNKSFAQDYYHDSLAVRAILDTNLHPSTTVESVTTKRNDRIVQLRLWEIHLIKIPPIIKQLNKLDTLIIHSCDLKFFSANISALTLLKYVDLQDNKLESLPPGIGNLSLLEFLYLQENELESLPAEIGNLSSLKYLRAWSNNLTSLPAEIGNLNSLTELRLWKNNLISLPAEIGNMSSLVTLHISDNMLTSIPAEIGNCSSLTSLFINNNNLKSLPAEIGNCSLLSNLRLRSNDLTSLPAEIGNLNSMVSIIADSNKLTSLPAEIGNLSLLENLNLIANNLTSLPNEIGNCSSLEEIDLHANDLTSLPAEIGNCNSLTILNVTNNKLTSIPGEIGNMSSLDRLNLSENELTTLPAGLENSSSLRFLEVDNNRISSVPPELGFIAPLRVLLLNNNNLITLPDSIVKLNVRLEIGYNHLDPFNLSTEMCRWLDSEDPDWVETQTPVQVPTAPVLVSPTNGAGEIDTNATLSWNHSSGTIAYNVQVATDVGFINLVVDQDTIATTSHNVVGLLNNTQYFWRVNATNTGGTSTWSNTWNFNTINSAPELIAPANNAKGIAISTTLTWSPLLGATSYSVQVATDTSFSNLVVDQSGIAATSHAVTGLLNNTQYFWRINASNTGGTSPWSSTWNFLTIVAAPVPFEPANNSAGIDITPTLSWNTSPGAVTYSVQVATDIDFINLVVNQSGIAATSHAVTGLLNNTQYYWRINATNAGGTSPWSNIWNFLSIVAAPMLVSPPNNSAGIVTNPTLSWNSSTGAATYSVQVATDSIFTNLVVDQKNITTTSHNVINLLNNTRYFWRVNATNTGGTSTWSNTWNFRTIIAAPLLVSPANGAVGIAVDPTLTWSAFPGASAYGVQVATDSGFTFLVTNQSDIAATSYSITGLLNNIQYFWRVNAINAGGTSAWSKTWNFTVIATEILDTNVVEPVKKSSIFSFHPSIVSNKYNNVRFYFFTKDKMNASLVIFDAIGNTVYENDYSIQSSQELLQFDSWDLTNKYGKKVGCGSYLVIFKAFGKNGKIEMFKRMIGVKEGF